MVVSTGIGATLLSIFILFEAGLYAESVSKWIIHSYEAFYGWWYWIKRKYKPEVQVSYCNRNEWMIVITHSTGRFCFIVICPGSFLLLQLFHIGIRGCLAPPPGQERCGCSPKRKNRELDIT